MSKIDDGVINIAEHPKLLKELKLVKESSKGTVESKALLKITDLKRSFSTISVSQKIHEELSDSSIDIASKLFEEWKKREEVEQKLRKLVMLGTSIFLGLQFIVALIFIYLVGRGFLAFENSTIILTAFFGVVILEFIGLLAIVMKYLYNERTTKALTIVAEILRDAGTNNRGYQQPAEMLDS